MIPGLTNQLLARLIGIGRREAFDEFQQLLTDFPEARSGQLMRQPLQEWYEVARRYSRDEVTALVKALTAAERDLPNFCGGSVSPVIALYRYLLVLDPRRVHRVARLGGRSHPESVSSFRLQSLSSIVPIRVSPSDGRARGTPPRA